MSSRLQSMSLCFRKTSSLKHWTITGSDVVNIAICCEWMCACLSVGEPVRLHADACTHVFILFRRIPSLPLRFRKTSSLKRNHYGVKTGMHCVQTHVYDRVLVAACLLSRTLQTMVGCLCVVVLVSDDPACCACSFLQILSLSTTWSCWIKLFACESRPVFHCDIIPFWFG